MLIGICTVQLSSIYISWFIFNRQLWCARVDTIALMFFFRTRNSVCPFLIYWNFYFASSSSSFLLILSCFLRSQINRTRTSASFLFQSLIRLLRTSHQFRVYIEPKSLVSLMVLTRLHAYCLYYSSICFLVSNMDLLVYFDFLLLYSFTNYSRSLWVLLLLFSIQFFTFKYYLSAQLYMCTIFLASDFAYLMRMEGFFLRASRSTLALFSCWAIVYLCEDGISVGKKLLSRNYITQFINHIHKFIQSCRPTQISFKYWIEYYTPIIDRYYLPMRILVQRVFQSWVKVGGIEISRIKEGLLVLVGITHDDNPDVADHMVSKILNMRLWEKEGKSWNGSVMELGGQIMVVSQFTLYGILKGNKPDFHASMEADRAKQLFNYLVDELKNKYNKDRIQTGKFQALMEVGSVINGPVTIQYQKAPQQMGKKKPKPLIKSKKQQAIENNGEQSKTQENPADERQEISSKQQKPNENNAKD